MVPMRKRCVCLMVLCFAFFLSPLAWAQDWFRTGTGLGVQKARVAVSDFAARSAEAKPHADLFSEVVRNDLDFSGIIDLVSKSFYPLQTPSVPAELQSSVWSDAPVSAFFLAFGNLSESSSEVAVQAWFYDVRNPSAPPVIGKVYRDQPTEAAVRKLAHEFADEIVNKLSGGVPGIGSTHIAFVSSRSGAKEIWEMDSDGADQRRLTSLNSISLTPRWSPDASLIAFTCYVRAYGALRPEICLYSLDLGKLAAFPRSPGSNSAPAWSPDGSALAFSSSMHGSPEVYSCDANGGRAKQLTFSAGVNTSPSWNPKTGQTIAFVSDRGGSPQLYLMNADGSNVEKLDVPDMGYVVDPSWAPNGQLLAFSWRRPNGNYDIYIMEVATRHIVQLTRDAGRNERPSWAPDGRHIVFESTRSGSRQIWAMLADGTEARQLTSAGENESANWSPR